MTFKTSSKTILIALLILFISAGLAGCKGSPAATPTAAVPTEAPTATAAPAEIILVDAQGNAGSALTDLISQFAGDNLLQSRTLSALTAADISSGTKIVIFSADPGNVAELSTSAPVVQFVVLGENALTSGGNVSTIKSNPADRAFMAGYLTMLLANDWRAAGLLTSDSSIGNSYEDAFVNGAKYVCGKCNPYYSPLVSFPVVAVNPTGSDAATWANDAAALGQDWLSTAFIDPAAANLPVANALSAYPINYESVTFVGYEEVSRDNGLIWDVLLSYDVVPSLKDLLPKLLAGTGGQQVDAAITLDLVNPDSVSPARQQLFYDTAAKLVSGEIEPLSIP